MKITVINNQPAGTTPIPCVDTTSVGPGETHVMTGRAVEEVATQMDHADGNDVIVMTEIEGIDRSPIVCAMKKPANPAGGVDTLAACGFDLNTEAGVAANVAPQMYLGVFDDAACTTPATTATLDTAATGTIDAGAGSNLLTVTPSAAGEVSVTLSESVDQQVFLKAWPVGSSYIVDSSDVHSPTFTA